MATPAPLRKVRRSKPDQQWSRTSLAALLGISVRQIDRYRARGLLEPSPSATVGLAFSRETVLAFMERVYYADQVKAVQS